MTSCLTPWSRLRSSILRGDNVICVNTSAVAEEEVKVHRRCRRARDALSKKVQNALLEAVGSTSCRARTKARLIECLADCDSRTISNAASNLPSNATGIKFTPVDILDLFAVEIDFDDDLAAPTHACCQGARMARQGQADLLGRSTGSHPGGPWSSSGSPRPRIGSCRGPLRDPRVLRRQAR